MDDGLSGDEVAAFRARLIDLEAQLRDEDSDSSGWRKTVELDQQSVGRLSRMDALQQQAMAEAEARRRKTDIIRIQAALERIDTQEFGWCLACGEPVGAKRLEIDPIATHCIGCAR